MTRRYVRAASRPRFEARQAERRESIRRLYDMGWSDRRIAAYLHVDAGTIRRDRKAMSLPRLFEPGRKKLHAEKLPDGVIT